MKQKIEISFEGINLPNLDVGSLTDPFVVLWSVNKGRKIKLGATEMIADNLNPKWVKTIVVDYLFEQ